MRKVFRFSRLSVLITILTVLLLIAGSEITDTRPKSPEPSIVTICKIIDVYDGDTITIETTFRMKVRLLDCWAPEVRTKDLKEKVRGLKARDYLRKVALHKHGKLMIPLTEDTWKSFTFGRVLGHVWVEGKEKSLSVLMIESGHATKNK